MHFAIELARLGNKVFFVEPPRASRDQETVSLAGETMGVQIIRTKPLRHALFLRHKMLPAYNWLMQRYIQKIKQLAGQPIDELWNFNPNSFIDTKQFGAKKNLLLLYDFYTGPHVVQAAKAAQLLLAPSQLILDHYNNIIPSLFVQHGLGNHFAEHATHRLHNPDFKVVQAGKVKVGYTGNLLRQAMNISVVKNIISSHPDIEFHFWGPHSLDENNVTDATIILSEEWKAFLLFLKECPAVYLHGVKDQPTLAAAMQEMDMFLFVYSAVNDMNAASNSHKLLEYISTGKVVVGTLVSTYENTGLMEMTKEEAELPELFTHAVQNLAQYNEASKQQQRMNYALDNTYAKQVERITQRLYAS